MPMECYLDTARKETCFGCEACVQICPVDAISLHEDEEGFRYPTLDENACISCMKCRNACPYAFPPDRHPAEARTAFGGSISHAATLEDSTSGGLFTALAETWFETGGDAVFGVRSNHLDTAHGAAFDKRGLAAFRKSKYTQSSIGTAYRETRGLLAEGKRVLFSGTPCQIAGLRAFLGNANKGELITVEVVCEGVPSPLFIRSLDRYMRKRYGSGIWHLDYRYKDNKRWDFEVMRIVLENGHVLKADRWVNPFWTIWIGHLMSRPSCYGCPFACAERGADITLGDLWGVHLYCPDLYRENAGASLAVCNTDRGRALLTKALPRIQGHELNLDDALRYQGPLRSPISAEPRREEFLSDASRLDFPQLVRKWAKRPTIKLLWSKYMWGNRQKVALWNLRRRLHGEDEHRRQ